MTHMKHIVRLYRSRGAAILVCHNKNKKESCSRLQSKDLFSTSVKVRSSPQEFMLNQNFGSPFRCHKTSVYFCGDPVALNTHVLSVS